MSTERDINKMDVDGTGSDSGDVEADNEVEDAMKNGLKRSCSAPLINQLFQGEAAAFPLKLKPTSYLSASGRWRRWSTSVSPVSPIGSSQSAGWARLNRLRVEETSDIGKQEIATEREVQRGLNIEKKLSQSWEDLSLSEPKEPKPAPPKRPTDPTVPLTVGVGPFPSPKMSPSPSPSPTRSSVPGKQCFSPSMQMPVPTNLSFSPSPSSSPTRKSWTRRSLSPITLRPSALGPVKRKCMLDDSETTPSKRHSSSLLTTHQIHARPSMSSRMAFNMDRDGGGELSPASPLANFSFSQAPVASPPQDAMDTTQSPQNTLHDKPDSIPEPSNLTSQSIQNLPQGTNASQCIQSPTPRHGGQSIQNPPNGGGSSESMQNLPFDNGQSITLPIENNSRLVDKPPRDQNISQFVGSPLEESSVGHVEDPPSDGTTAHGSVNTCQMPSNSNLQESQDRPSPANDGPFYRNPAEDNRAPHQSKPQ